MAVSAAAVRRTQAQRTASMRARLLDATLECLVELGYAGTTTTEVVRRAGVSRGAQVHHFPTKQDLVVGAIGHLLDRRQDEFRATFGALEPEERSMGRALELLWSLFREPSFAAWLELGVAARTDEQLRAHFLAIEARFAARTAELFDEFFPGAKDPELTRVGVAFAFTVLDGLALQSHLGMDSDADAVMGVLQMLSTMFAGDLGGAP